jgi:hypothetical protein
MPRRTLHGLAAVLLIFFFYAGSLALMGFLGYIAYSGYRAITLGVIGSAPAYCRELGIADLDLSGTDLARAPRSS